MSICPSIYVGHNVGIKTSTLSKFESGIAGALVGSVDVSGGVTMNYKIGGALTGAGAVSDVTNALAGKLEGALTGSGAVTGEFVSLGPTLLSDFDFSTPATSWTTGRDNFTSAFATDEWTFQSHTTGSYPNNVGTATLDNLNGLTDRDALGITNAAGSPTAYKAWEGVNGTTGISCSDSTVGDPGSGDFCVRVVFRCTLEQVTSNDVIVAKRQSSAGNPGWALAFTGSTGNLGITYDDGTTSTVDYIVGTHADGAWHYVTFWLDASEGDGFIKSDLVTEQSDLANSLGSISSSSALTINNHWVGHTSSSMGGFQVAYLGICEGANAQSMYDETFWQHASDPTALLTTQTRGSLISIPISATQVSHYTDDTLAIGFNSNFTSGYGLYCNSAVTNLITESEALSNWTSSNMTETDNFGDAPDGFRSATKLAATADNGYSAETFTTTAATEYTLSCYVREITVGCTGRVIFYDETGAAELGAQAFTCTSANQLVSVTATTNAGQVSSSMRIEIDTNTEECYAMMCQANLARGRGAYVRTSGASAALVASHFEANAAAGTLTTSITGESESIFVQARDDGATRYVYHNQTTSNQNRHWLRLDSSLNVKSHIYDSSGSYVDDLTAASTKDFDAQENTVVNRWDSAGTLAAGGGVGFSTKWNSDSAVTGVVTWTATDNLQDVEIGSVSSGNANLDGFVQQVRFWDGERS